MGIARELGVNVWAMHSMPANISGKIFRDSLNGGTSGFSIAVNADEHPVRQRFTIAHEIAHFILHRARLETGDLVDDTMYRSGLSTAEEIAANRLAAQILMPMELIQTLISQGVNDVPSLAAKFQVSQAAMKIRLGIPVT
jgi:Zn-dependent peptidase ImmA (M78 family)